MPATPISELDLGCTTCLGVSIGDAAGIAFWELIAESISPSGETFYRISAVGDVRISAVGDNRVYQ